MYEIPLDTLYIALQFFWQSIKVLKLVYFILEKTFLRICFRVDHVPDWACFSHCILVSNLAEEILWFTVLHSVMNNYY